MFLLDGSNPDWDDSKTLPNWETVENICSPLNTQENKYAAAMTIIHTNIMKVNDKFASQERFSHTSLVVVLSPLAVAISEKILGFRKIGT